MRGRIKSVLICVVLTSIISMISTYIISYNYNSNNKKNTTNIKGVKDELYDPSSDYNSLASRVSALETPTTLDVSITDTTYVNNGSVHLVKVGKVVHCYFYVSMKANSTTWSYINLQPGIIPAAYRPKVNTVGIAVRQDTSSYLGTWSQSIVNTSGTLAISLSSPIGNQHALGGELIWATN